jgi:uncharacterized protein
MKCFYHSADLDGHCSGAIVKHFNPECELIGFNYGQEFPWDSIQQSETVFIVDVSLPIEQMVKLAQITTLVWIDHHIGIIREFYALPEEQRGWFDGRRDPSKAACELCWEFFREGDPVPLVVATLGVYDSWRFTDFDEEFVKQFQYGMRMEDDTRPENAMSFWESMFAAGRLCEQFESVMSSGAAIYKYQLSQNENNCRSCAFETELLSFPLRLAMDCIAINSNLMNSDVFKSVWDPEKYDAMLCFYWSNKGFWRVSIYSTNPEVDCSVWAKSFGGGGHKGAAGFQCEELPFALGKNADGSKGGV